MFRKRHLDKKVDLNRDIESIQVHKEDRKANLDKSVLSKKISKGDKEQHGGEHQKTLKYGLIEKEFEPEEKPQEENTILKLYIQTRMEEINHHQEHQGADTTTNEILQMQKQYLSTAESKITEYDVKQVQKKLEKMAAEAIKSEMENKNKYLVDLLQNEYERMEYASKKELKVLKQERERLQKELSSKYASEGRRHYLEYVKQENYKEMQ